MNAKNTTHEYHINAAGRRLGRVATEAATALIGKRQPDFTKHTVAKVVVKIENASQLDIPDKKKTELYQSYSGYPSGPKTETLVHLANRRGYSEVLRRTIKGMLPKNKLQALRMKQLIVTE